MGPGDILAGLLRQNSIAATAERHGIRDEARIF
jgi:hypothetical protein